MGFRDDLRGKNFLDTPLGASVVRYRRMFIVASQILLIIAAFFLAFILRYEGRPNGFARSLFRHTLPWLVLIKVVVFYYYDLYRGWWRYVGIDDLIDVIKASTVATALFVVVALFFFPVFPRSVFVTDWFITLTFIGGIRFGLRAVREKLLHDRSGKVTNVLIYGSRAIGVELLKEIRGNPQLGMNVIGFIDDFAPKKGFKIHGVSILGGRDEIPRILERYNVDEIIISSPSLKAKELKDLIGRFKEADVRFKIIPPMADIINERVSIKQLRDVSVVDLLGRKAVRPDTDFVRRHLEGKVVLITGAGGSIGAELARQVADTDPEAVILLERNENNLFMVEWDISSRFPHVRLVSVIGDILDRPSLDRVMQEHKPQVVFHAAAYKHVPMMEIHPAAAVKNNVEGTLNTALAAVEAGVERFVFISTDKAVHPTNVMGMTKRVGELILQSLAKKGSPTKFIAVRFGNVMGSAGSVIPLFQRQIARGGPVTVTHPKARRYFMTIPEAVQLVMQAAAMGMGGEIFVLEMGEQINILELAKNLIRLSGLDEEKDIEVKFIGLRPGEKLAEELYSSKEELESTGHEKIYAMPAAKRGPDERIEEMLRDLTNLADMGNIDEALELMRKMTKEDATEPEPRLHPPAVLH